jgi:hypothetical protein
MTFASNVRADKAHPRKKFHWLKPFGAPNCTATIQGRRLKVNPARTMTVSGTLSGEP